MRVSLSPFFFFLLVDFLVAGVLFSSHARCERGMQAGRKHQKEARTISNSTAPRVRAHVFLQGGTTCHGSRKAEQTQLLLNILFVCVCVCARARACPCPRIFAYL